MSASIAGSTEGQRYLEMIKRLGAPSPNSGSDISNEEFEWIHNNMRSAVMRHPNSTPKDVHVVERNEAFLRGLRNGTIPHTYLSVQTAGWNISELMETVMRLGRG